jgi:hypothetical protein
MCTFLLSNTPILQFVSLSIITANQSRSNFILAYLLLSSASPRLNLASLRLATNELASSAFSKCNQNSGGYRLSGCGGTFPETLIFIVVNNYTGIPDRDHETFEGTLERGCLGSVY